MNYLVLTLLCVVLLISVYTDLKWRKIYNVVTITAIVAIIVIRLFHHPQGAISYLWGIVPAVIFYVGALLTKGKAAGGGDILLLFFLGLTMGAVGTVLTLVYSCVLLVLFSVVYFLLTNRKFTQAPMAIFFALGVGIFYTQPYWLSPFIA